MAALGKSASRWLRQDDCSTPASLVGPFGDQDDYAGRSVAENLVIIKNFWRQIWQRQGICEELRRVREGNLACQSEPRLPDLHLSAEGLLPVKKRATHQAPVDLETKLPLGRSKFGRP